MKKPTQVPAGPLNIFDVADCQDCPHNYDSGCSHPLADRLDTSGYEGLGAIPIECPLRTAPSLIRLDPKVYR